MFPSLPYRAATPCAETNQRGYVRMKKIISAVLAACLALSVCTVMAESLKDTNVIGQMEFLDPANIYLSQKEADATVKLSETVSITVAGAVNASDGQAAPALLDFKYTGVDTPLRTVEYRFAAPVSVSGIRLYDEAGSVTGGSIYGSADGESFALIGNIKAGGRVAVTDFGFNISVAALAVETTGSGNLKLNELHVIKANGDYEDTTLSGLGDFSYWPNGTEAWTVTASSEFKSNPASFFVDGDKSSFWHSDYTVTASGVQSANALPHWVSVDFGREKVISGVRYTPRNGGSRVTLADIYLSPDGKSFYKAARGRFSYSLADDKVIDFGENISVRAVRFVSVETEGQEYSTGAELEFKKANMAYTYTDFADEIPAATAKALSASATGTGIENAFDEDGSTAYTSSLGDAIVIRSGEKMKVSGIRFHAADGKNAARVRLSVSEDGTDFVEFAEAALTDGKYLFRANLNVRAVRAEITAIEDAAPEFTEIALIPECLSYNDIDVFSEIRDTSSFTVTASSENALQPATNLIDGNIHSIWHSYYNSAKGEQDKPPIDIVVDLGKLTKISGFNYYPTRSGKDADSAGYFKSLKTFVTFSEEADAEWYPVKTESYTYGGYYNVQCTRFDFNLTVRKVKITVTGGNYDYATAGEIRFLRGAAGDDPKNAALTEKESVFELDEFDSYADNIEIAYSLNDGGRLTAFREGGRSVDPAYYSVTDGGILLSKYFFLDCLQDPQNVVFTLDFLIGDSLTYTVRVGGAERHRVYFNTPTGAAVSVTSGGRSVDSGGEAKRKNPVSFTVTADDGYRVKGVTVSAEAPLYDEIAVDNSEFTVTASNEFSGNPAANMKDSNAGTYWHSYYEVSNGSAVNPTGPPHDITLTFTKGVTALGGIKYTPRRDNDGGRIISYKVYASADGTSFDSTPIAAGLLTNSADEQTIKFNSILGTVRAIKLSVLSTSGGTFCQIAEISPFKLIERKPGVTISSEGTKETAGTLDDLFTDVRLTVETEKIAAGRSAVTMLLTNVEALNAPAEVENGKDAVVSFKATDGLWMPDAVSVTVGGKTQAAGKDYIYTKTTNDTATVKIKNVSGEIVIKAAGMEHDTYAVTYTDNQGAAGTLPETTYVRAGKSFTVAGCNLGLSGYTFAGWSYNGQTYSPGAEFTMPGRAVTFTAVWRLSGGSGGGGGGGGGGSKPSSTAKPPAASTPAEDNKENNTKGHNVYIAGTGFVKVADGATVSDAKEIPGYKFSGWYLDEALTVPYGNTGVTEALTLYPKYDRIRGKGELTDIEGHWARDVIERLYIDGIINGYSDTTFLPDALITRAEFLSLLYKAAKGDGAAEVSFIDVSYTDWFYSAVSWAVKNGITRGTSDITFSPNAGISREEMAVMCQRLIALLGKSTEARAAADFYDNASVSDWARDAIGAINSSGIMTGYPDGTFLPRNNASRAEAAVVIQRILDK